ncbi:MAG: hypothetical protein ACM358_15760 [Gemmatimonadota bacterium]
MTRGGLVLAGWILVGATAVACQGVGPAARPTNERLRGYSQADSVNAITAYVRSLGDTGFVTVAGAGDEQRLRSCVSKPCTYGPLAAIQPRARITDSGSVTLRAGEVIARIINYSDIGYVYRVSGRDTSYKFNLHARDTVYWWVGRRDTTLVSVFFSSRRGARPMVSDLATEPHERYWKQSLARWIWDEADEKGWGTCDGGVCCQSSGIAADALRR